MVTSFINFLPHIGKKFHEHGFFGKKILVLGESHYCIEELAEGGRCHPYCSKSKMKEECFSQTIDWVEGVIYDFKFRTFTNFERAVYGRELSEEEHIDFWESVLFYNYLQFSQPAPKHQLHQTDDAYDISSKAFLEVLHTYKPDFVIAWGTSRLYDMTPNGGGKASELKITNDGSAPIWIYPIDDKEIPTLFIQHPANYFSWEAWHPYIKKFLSL